MTINGMSLNEFIDSIRHQHILYVEDDAKIAKIMLVLLDEFFDSVIHANSAEKALELLEKENDFNLVISDIHMGKMNGLELASIIKENNKDISIFIFSGDHEKIKKCAESGTLECMVKPIDLNKLMGIFFNLFLK